MKKIFCIVMAISLFASCSGKRAVSSGASQDSDRAPAPFEASSAQDSQDRINEIEFSIERSRERKRVHDNEVSTENYGEKRFLNAAGAALVLPDDFVVGHLVDARKSPDSAEAAVALFFDDFKRNRIAKNPGRYFTDDNRMLLFMLFDEWYDEKLFPDAVRVGTPVLMDGSVHISVRCLMDDGACLCDFVMAKDEGAWKIANFSGNLDEMRIPLEKGDEFEPEVYYFF